MDRPLFAFLFVTCIILAGSFRVHASDPELTSDFKVPENESLASTNSSFFTHTKFRDFKAVESENRAPFPAAVRADLTTFPALDGLGVSAVLFEYLPGDVNPPHIHPRGSELVFIVQGGLDIGFVDTTNTLRTQTLKQGDLFVIPKGLVHFQNNEGDQITRVFSAFSSANPGLSRLPSALFNSTPPISDKVLQKSFGVSADVIQKLKAAQA